MIPDVLGDGYQVRDLPLRGDTDEKVVATLVRYPAEKASRGAILYVHGFVDYFFQTHVAEHFAKEGFDFYAVDLRAYGRSLRPHQLPNYVTDLATHFEELEAAATVIRAEDGHRRLTVLGHSTGGLITALWAHEHRADDLIDALVLNSPWLDLAEPWILRTVGTAVIGVLGRFLPTAVVQKGLDQSYAHSLLTSHHGEWSFEQDWKPVSGFPVRAGWLRTVRRGHAKLHRGLDVRVPVLVLHSTRSMRRPGRWSQATMSADTVLDVTQMARWAPKIGARVTVVAVDGGMHDLFLSAEPVRRRALAEVDTWLTDNLPGPPSS